MHPQHAPDRGSSVAEASIIVPTRNRAKALDRCLTSLAEQSTHQGRFEIVIVDNASTDETPTVAARFIELRPHHRVRYVHEPVPGLLAGRHRGAFEGSGDVLCFVDDDVIADPDWLCSVLDGFEDPDVQLIGGPSIARYEQAPPSWLDSFETVNPDGRYLDSLSLIDLGPTIHEIAAYYVWGLNFNIRKRALVELGGFHPDGVPSRLIRYRGDGEGGLSAKLMETGYKTIYHPGAIVEHSIGPERLNIDYLKKRRFLQGVSDSYSAIRGADGSSGVELRPMPEPPAGAGMENAEAFLRFETDVAHVEGFNFHLTEVRSDPDLLAWVLRPSYLEWYDYGQIRPTEANRLPQYFR